MPNQADLKDFSLFKVYQMSIFHQYAVRFLKDTILDVEDGMWYFNN